MTVTPTNPLALAHWRRTVAALYGVVRDVAEKDAQRAWQTFRATRDMLFRHHPQTPLSAEQRADFTQLPYFDYAPAGTTIGHITTDTKPLTLTGDEWQLTRIGLVHFTLYDQDLQLSLYWVDGYGGGLFLPFRDGTNGQETFGGGRYLYDTIKGADLGVGEQEIVLDFNFAYNPSCSYNDQWVCPLPPSENWLGVRIPAGEKRFNS